MTVTRVLVVDDQRLIREGIAELLAVQEGIEVIGTAADGREAVDRALETVPDVVLMDVRMPVLDGVDAAVELRERLPSVRVLMLTTFDDEDYVIRALRAGASGYLLKDLPAQDLARAVQLAHAGLHPHNPTVSHRLIALLDARDPTLAALTTADTAPVRTTTESGEREGSARTRGGGADDRHRTRPGTHDTLTDREHQVLRLLATGASNREIARSLRVSEGTIKNYVSRVLAHLGLRDRVQAAIYARDHHLG